MTTRRSKTGIILALVIALPFALFASANAGPPNFGRALVVVTNFGADPLGGSDSEPAIQAAINSCDPAGCTVFFPSGHYLLSTVPTLASSYLTTPAGVPVTLEGTGQGSSVLQLNAAPSADIVQAAAGSAGFGMHDLGILFNAVPTAGAAVRVISASSANLYNLSVSGAYDAFGLGQAGATTAQAASTNVRGINASGVMHCFLNLSGGVQNTYVRGTYAEAAPGTPSSQVACSGSTQGSSGFGIAGLHVRDASFAGFGRGFDFAASQTILSDMVLDNVSITTATGGPAFELYLPNGSSSSVQNISITNSTFQSAASACVLHGAASAIRLRNVTCDGGIPAALPTGCTGSASSRGYAVLALSGTGGTTPQTVTVTVTPPGGMPQHASTTVTVGEPASSVAASLGANINASALVTGGCPLLLPVSTYLDVGGSDASIGSEIELFSYQYGPGITPAISVSAGAGSVGISVLNGATVFAGADGIYAGTPNSTSFPSAVSIMASSASPGQNGAALHLQGASALSAAANTLSDRASTAPFYGVWVDGSSGSYTDALLQDNNLSTATSPVYFGGTTASGFGPNLQFSSNTGYDPSGHQAATVNCNSPLANPFPFAVEVYISGFFTNIQKNGTSVFIGSGGMTQNDTVLLGVGETITIICTPASAPATAWFGQ